MKAKPILTSKLDAAESPTEMPLDLSQSRKSSQCEAAIPKQNPALASGSPEPGEIGPGQPRPTNILEAIMSLGKQQQLAWRQKQATATAPREQVNRCQDCDIVFFKEENFRVHKELYCAGRHSQSKLADHAKQQKMDDRSSEERPQQSPQASPLNAGRRSPEGSDEFQLQYVCVPCNIRFSSIDTLEAHQGYYCPARKGQALVASALRSPHKQNAQKQTKREREELACRRCFRVFTNSDDLRRHDCRATPALATTMKIPVYCCPHCEFVASSDQRLLDHIKTHAPTKAYRCQLCGYRGNTVRGMRMHGKSTHMDAGERFTDDNIIEFHEPPLVPKRLRTTTESVEVHLMRGAHLPPPPATIDTNKRKRTTSTPVSTGDSLAHHNDVVPVKRSKPTVTSPKSFKIANILGHDDRESNDSTKYVGEAAKCDGLKMDTSQSEKTPAERNVKEEHDDTKPTEAANYCKECDIPFVYLSTYLAHKKYYCSSHAKERKTASPSEA